MGVMAEIDMSYRYHYADERKKVLQNAYKYVPQTVQQSVQTFQEVAVTVPESEPRQPEPITPCAVSEEKPKKKRTYIRRDNSKIIQFLEYIQATPDFSNSFKVIKTKGNSGFRTIIFFKQNDSSREIVNNVYFGKRDYYVTKNSYVGNQTRTETLFSLDNVVIDIDNHKLSAKKVEREVERLLYFLDNDYNGKLPQYGIVRTGRGVQLWIGLQSMAAAPKLIYRYEQITKYFCNLLTEIIRECDINLEVDVSASVRANGFVRLPETRNSHRRDRYVITYERFPLTRYQWQELFEEYTDIELNSEKKSEKVVPTIELTEQKKQEQKSNKPMIQRMNTGESESDYTPFTLKQVRFIQKLVEVNNGNVGGRRELLLFHYCNALMQVADVQTAKQMAEELNQKFSKPLSETEISCAVKSPQKKTYHYSKVRFLADICVNEDERQLYAEMTEYREEKRKKAREKKIQRNQQIIQLKAQGMNQQQIAEQVSCDSDTVGKVLHEYNENGKVKRDNQIITLHKKGMNQQQIAEQVGCSRTVVNKVLKATQKASKTERNEMIIRLHQQGQSAKAIAEQAGCSRRTVNSVLADYKAVHQNQEDTEQGVQNVQKTEKTQKVESRGEKTMKSTEISHFVETTIAKKTVSEGVQNVHESEKPP